MVLGQGLQRVLLDLKECATAVFVLSPPINNLGFYFRTFWMARKVSSRCCELAFVIAIYFGEL
jgi:hypothetical protein